MYMNAIQCICLSGVHVRRSDISDGCRFFPKFVSPNFPALPTSSAEEDPGRQCEVHGLNQQATWMFEMLYGRSRTQEEVAARRESLANIEGIASRSLHFL